MDDVVLVGVGVDVVGVAGATEVPESPVFDESLTISMVDVGSAGAVVDGDVVVVVEITSDPGNVARGGDRTSR